MRKFIVTDHTGPVPITQVIVSTQDHYIYDSDNNPIELIQSGMTETGEFVILQEIQA